MPHRKTSASRSVRFRLVLAIPLVLFCLTLATGWTVFAIFYVIPHPSLPLQEGLVRARLIPLILALVSAGIGLVLALTITTPLRRLTDVAESLFLNKGSQMVTDEVGSLVLAFNRMMLSMDRFISDSYILENLRAGLITTDEQGEITYTNAVAREALGFKRLEDEQGREILGTNVIGLFAQIPENQEALELLQKALNGAHAHHRDAVATLMTTGGQECKALVEVGTLAQVSPAEKARVFISFRCLEEQERVRREIRRTDQLATVGGLAASLAHELKNPLGSIGGLIELLQADFSPNDPRRRYCRIILEATRHMEKLIEELLSMVRTEREEQAPVDIAELIRNAMALIKEDAAKKQIQLMMEEAEPDIPTVEARAGALSHAFLNILQNAVQASPVGGCIRVKVAPGPDSDAAQHQAGYAVIVRVTNTGSYIPSEQREQIFRPFVSSKSGGAGLGLFIARQFIESQRGTITVESSHEEGTSFEIRLAAPERRAEGEA